MIRVLHVVGDSRFGGGSIVVLRLAELARSLGWDVQVLTTDPVFKEVLDRAGLGTLSIDVIRRRIRPFWDLAGAFRLLRHLRRNPYTIVHTHTSKAGFVGRWAAHRANVPVIVHTVHGFAFHEASPWLPTRLYAAMERLAARWCDRLVTVSEYHREWAAQLGIGDSSQRVAIVNGLAMDRVAADRTRCETRREWSVLPGEAVVLSMGRLAKQKGLEYLIDAAAVVAGCTKKPLRVVLVGEGPLRESLEHRARSLGIADRILFFGFRQDVGNLLAACDVVAIPSLWEGLSIALLEAMAARKPIVATAIGSNCEATQDGRGALLVPPRDPCALAAAIVRLLEDHDLARTLAEKAFEIYCARYTEERMLEEYRKLYCSCLQERRIGAAHAAGGGNDRRQPRSPRGLKSVA